MITWKRMFSEFVVYSELLLPRMRCQCVVITTPPVHIRFWPIFVHQTLRSVGVWAGCFVVDVMDQQLLVFQSFKPSNQSLGQSYYDEVCAFRDCPDDLLRLIYT